MLAALGRRLGLARGAVGRRGASGGIDAAERGGVHAARSTDAHRHGDDRARCWTAHGTRAGASGETRRSRRRPQGGCARRVVSAITRARRSAAASGRAVGRATRRRGTVRAQPAQRPVAAARIRQRSGRDGRSQHARREARQREDCRASARAAPARAALARRGAREPSDVRPVLEQLQHRICTSKASTR